MHSSRMRTGRSLTVSCRSLLPVGGLLLGGSAPGGSGPGGVWSQGCLHPGGVCPGGSGPGGSAPGGLVPGGWGLVLGACLLPGGSAPRGGGISACTEADPPPVDRITDACKNIALAQLRCGR